MLPACRSRSATRSWFVSAAIARAREQVDAEQSAADHQRRAETTEQSLAGLVYVFELLAPVTREREHVEVGRSRNLLLRTSGAVGILVERHGVRLVEAAK